MRERRKPTLWADKVAEKLIQEVKKQMEKKNPYESAREENTRYGK